MMTVLYVLLIHCAGRMSLRVFFTEVCVCMCVCVCTLHMSLMDGLLRASF